MGTKLTDNLITDSKRGFITVATGREEYYKIAVNLLNSYRQFTENPLPFAILAEEENEYTEQFDQTIILRNPRRTYMDKLEVLNNIPFEETIFIESDILAYKDLNKLFECFSVNYEFFIEGENYDIYSKKGWFLLNEAGEFKDKIKFIPRFHSGIIFLKKSEVCKTIYNNCIYVRDNFEKFNIGGSMVALDDKCLALAMALTDCRCIPIKEFQLESFHLSKNLVVYPHLKCKSKLVISMQKKKLFYKAKRKVEILACHFGNSLTRESLYQREIYILKCFQEKEKINKKLITKKNKDIFLMQLKESWGGTCKKIKSFFKWIGAHFTISWIKYRWGKLKERFTKNK